MSITQIKKSISPSKNNRLFFLILFAACFITRLPTLFNDFYDVDELSAIVQTKEWLNGLIPFVDFAESKRMFFHALFKFAYTLFPVHGWVFLHVITIVIIFLTAVCIYHMGRITRGKKEGMLAALLYGMLISSFNRHFMATNGEVIYNLPVTAGALFFVLALRPGPVLKRILFVSLVILCVICAMQVKFHGLILAIFLVFYIFFYLPWYKGFAKKIIIPYILIALSITAVFILLYVRKSPFLIRNIEEAKGMFFYALYGRSTNPLYFIGVYSYRQLLLGLWHFIIWVPAFYLLYSFIKNKCRMKSMEESAFVVLFILTYSMIFAGGARMYFHYFMSCYPAMCLMASFTLLSAEQPFIKKLWARFTVLLMIPVLFFFAWNIKDDIIRNFAPNGFYNEGSFMFWARAIFVGNMNDYLLPNKSYRDTVEYIKATTSANDKIFVWGDGPNIYYFADRRIAIYHVWPKGTIAYLEDCYKDNTPASLEAARAIEDGVISMIESRKAELIIDTSPKGIFVGVTRFSSFATFPYPLTPMMRKYINEKFTLEKKVEGNTIYRRKKIRKK